jgi:hypothetical protein
VVDRQHLRAYEQLWINKLKPQNKLVAFRIFDKELRKQERNKSRTKLSDEISKKKRENIVECSCGLTINKNHKSRHMKTQKHAKLILLQESKDR